MPTLLEFQQFAMSTNNNVNVPFTATLAPSDVLFIYMSNAGEENYAIVRKNGVTVAANAVKRVDITSGAVHRYYILTGLTNSDVINYATGSLMTSGRITFTVVRGLNTPTLFAQDFVGFDGINDNANTPIYTQYTVKRGQFVIAIGSIGRGTTSGFPFDESPIMTDGWTTNGTNSFNATNSHHSMAKIIPVTTFTARMGITDTSASKRNLWMFVLGNPIPEISGWGMAI